MPSYFACHPSTGNAKSRHSSSRASTIRAEAAPQLWAFFRIASRSSHGCPRSMYAQWTSYPSSCSQPKITEVSSPPEYARTQEGMVRIEDTGCRGQGKNGEDAL